MGKSLDRWLQEVAPYDRNPYYRGRVGLRRHLAWHEDVMTEAEYAGVAAVAIAATTAAVGLLTKKAWLGVLIGLLVAPLAAETVLQAQDRAYRQGLRREAEGLGRGLVAAARSAE